MLEKINQAWSMILLMILLVLPTSEAAFAVEKTKCFDSIDAIRYALKDIPEKNMLYTFYTGEKAQYYLVMEEYRPYKDGGTAEQKILWRLLERSGDYNWCLIGTGSSVELLLSIHSMPESKEKFGMPGSGYKRCNDSNGGILETLEVRKWANKELGDSFVQHFQSEISNEGFTFLNAKKLVNGNIPWILISSESNDDKNMTSCYRGRGDKVILYKDYKIKAQLR
ncbi:MAG: hypothetical protein H6908_00040 [Hyphomicrobiales bacterium]|nr:hypothetical protein [Hyphomicrobiales bacterium]